MIEECITENFDIRIGDNLKNIKACINIKSLDDVKNVRHFIEFMYWDKKDTDISIHKDNAYYKHFKNIPETKEHFMKLGYDIEKKNRYIASTGCIVEKYFIEK